MPAINKNHDPVESVSQSALSLLGGVLVEGELMRSVIMRPIDGHLEKSLGEICAQKTSIPQRITDVVCAAVEDIGGFPTEPSRVNALSAGDRRYLILQIACLFEGDGLWLSPTCGRCSTRYDLYLDRREIPVQAAGPGFPNVSVDLGAKQVVVRIPNGEDELWVANQKKSPTEIEMLDRLLVSVDGNAPLKGFVDSLGRKELVKIDQVLDGVAPDVGSQLKATCAACAHEQVFSYDVAASFCVFSDGLIEDVHRLASTYHWTEKDILDLPRNRRRRYLNRIDNSRGLHG